MGPSCVGSRSRHPTHTRGTHRVGSPFGRVWPHPTPFFFSQANIRAQPSLAGPSR